LYKWKNRIKQKAFTKTTWSTLEDSILRQIVNSYGSKNWQAIANILNQELGEPNKRIGKQCRERWLNHLHPSVNKSQWTPAEDLLLLENHKKYSNQWAKIAKFIPGRTENMVKNRFNTIYKKKRDEIKTSKNLRKPLNEVIEEMEADNDIDPDVLYNSSVERGSLNNGENDWIDEMIAQLSVQMSNIDICTGMKPKEFDHFVLNTRNLESKSSSSLKKEKEIKDKNTGMHSKYLN